MASDNPFNTGSGRFMQPSPTVGGAARGLNLFTSPTLGQPFGIAGTRPSAVEQALGLPTVSNKLLGNYNWAAELDSLDRYRRRADWNARFEHWEKPASTTEESTLQRAQRMVKAAIRDAVWLNMQGATVEPQGSYHNRTNTRSDSDADLRLQLPLIKTFYHANVEVPCAQTVLGLADSGWTYDQLFTLMRWDLETCLNEAFGKANVIPGNKAFRVKGITGSRAEVDVVPALRYQNVIWLNRENRYNVLDGVAILSTDGSWTYNFPDHHRANGVAKRARTGHQFKKIVRIFKRLRTDLAVRGLLDVKVPSFLVESLIFNVEDDHFTVAGDDRYARVRRIAQRLQWMVRHEPTAAGMVEVNAIKPLFTAEQAWTWADTIAFADAAVAHLSDP